MVLQDYYKLTIWIKEKKFVYYRSTTEYINFREENKHEIIWKKPNKDNQLNVNSAVVRQKSLW